ncbi:hypothetical protein [Capnocytophaga canis]|uniref:hypothetical protein n=1 Tax=Capnocytophaga canis TaxID=1848903 RepID=UPI0011C233C3|nr:hypothetical protein [Capnocytophaga canis]
MKTRFLLILGLSFLLSSCQCTLIKLFNVQRSALKHKKVFVRGDQSFIYIPMNHLGRQQYYDEVKAYLEIKRSEGYTIYYEGMYLSRDTINQQRKDTLLLKRRKLMGFHLTPSYSDKNNHSLPKCYKKYVGQTMENTGIIYGIDVNIDMTTEEVIEAYEAKYGEIPLNECDFTTPLNTPYKCEQIKGVHPTNLLYRYSHTFRDEHLENFIKTVKDKKVILIFGRAHWHHGIRSTLIDENFEMIEGKI